MSGTASVCGEFVTPTRPDLGQCYPRRLKRDCLTSEDVEVRQMEAAEEVSGCEDPELTTESTPTLTPPYRIIASVFDTECEPILDENDEPVTGPTF